MEWQVAAGNQASIAVARRLGMTREGVLRQAYLHPGGVRHDIEIWSVLAPELETRAVVLISPDDHARHDRRRGWAGR